MATKKPKILVGGKRPTKTERQIIDAHNKKIRERQMENGLAEMSVRARSVTVGTSGGGTTEMIMRRMDGTVTWMVLQPVEVIELIHQLAANVGCHIHLQPRRDFSSWRDWKYTPEELAHYRGDQQLPGGGYAPHVKAMIDGGYSTELPPPEQQPGLPANITSRSDSDEQTVATQKAVGRNRANGTPAAA
jgi:hypothetical protein